MSRLELVYSNGKVESVEKVDAYCDMPWTMDLTASNILLKVTYRVELQTPLQLSEKALI